ncbi:MAG: helix-turn-helix domain-containing protein [Acidobacteriota bacterium]|nr:helix-turn-helix domain-containing protein [Blastocatellia bacterium]MDW8413463.1 helix-turn-helix domain-containing protein [Acidobacteriota bacterium]
MRDRLEAIVEEMISSGIRFEDAVAEFEKIFILRVLAKHQDNISRASQELGLHRNTLAKRVALYRKQQLGEPRQRYLRRGVSSDYR